jgi:hypothetical protein
MSDSYNDVEAHIQAVLASILSETKPNIMEIARDYVVPYQQL